jgi:glycosyltransferase involved in cell wall biosynthesis
VLVDDGSSDGTGEALRQEAISSGGHVRVISLQRNFGQTAAMQAGIDHATGAVIVPLDADLQNPPSEIPKLLAKLGERPRFKRSASLTVLEKHLADIDPPTLVLILDDAQNYPAPALEEIRMLLHQASPGFQAWFGTKPDVNVELRNFMSENL